MPGCAQPLSLILPCSSISLCHPVHPSPGLVKKVSGSIELFVYTAEGKQKLTFIAPQISPGFMQFSDLIVSLQARGLSCMGAAVEARHCYVISPSHGPYWRLL